MDALRSMGKGLLPLLVHAGISAAMVWGVFNRMGRKQKELNNEWWGETFSSLAWVAIGLLLLVLYLVWRERDKRPSLLLAPSASGLLQFGVAIFVFAQAWEGGRENYWSAFDFSTLIWAWQVGAVVAFASAIEGTRRGQAVAGLLVGPAGLAVSASLIAWSWTAFGFVRDWQAELLRSLWLATHG